MSIKKTCLILYIYIYIVISIFIILYSKIYFGPVKLVFPLDWMSDKMLMGIKKQLLTQVENY